LNYSDYSFSINIEYSINDGEWAPYTIGTSIIFGNTNGDLRLRGTGNYIGTARLT